MAYSGDVVLSVFMAMG